MNGGSLLAGSLEAVVHELREGRLQRAEETRGEELRREKERKPRLEDALPPIHRATKQLIASYGEKKELIPWALKVLVNKTNAQIFLYLEGKWQEKWLERMYEEQKSFENERGNK